MQAPNEVPSQLKFAQPRNREGKPLKFPDPSAIEREICTDVADGAGEEGHSRTPGRPIGN
jgi:hypothetical protein